MVSKIPFMVRLIVNRKPYIVRFMAAKLTYMSKTHNYGKTQKNLSENSLKCSLQLTYRVSIIFFMVFLLLFHSGLGTGTCDDTEKTIGEKRPNRW